MSERMQLETLTSRSGLGQSSGHAMPRPFFVPSFEFHISNFGRQLSSRTQSRRFCGNGGEGSVFLLLPPALCLNCHPEPSRAYFARIGVRDLLFAFLAPSGGAE